jgi:hypothetical protein
MQVSSYDLINPGGCYSARVRVLGSFHPVLSQRDGQTDAQDIDDPLYGNIGGQEEQVRRNAGKSAAASCNIKQQCFYASTGLRICWLYLLFAQAAAVAQCNNASFKHSSMTLRVNLLAFCILFIASRVLLQVAVLCASKLIP